MSPPNVEIFLGNQSDMLTSSLAQCRILRQEAALKKSAMSYQILVALAFCVIDDDLWIAPAKKQAGCETNC